MLLSRLKSHFNALFMLIILDIPGIYKKRIWI